MVWQRLIPAHALHRPKGAVTAQGTLPNSLQQQDVPKGAGNGQGSELGGICGGKALRTSAKGTWSMGSAAALAGTTLPTSSVADLRVPGAMGLSAATCAHMPV